MDKIDAVRAVIYRADADTLDAIEELCTLIATAARDRSALLSERARQRADSRKFIATLPPSQAEQRRVDRARRDRLILRLHAQGLKYRQIGKQVGLSKQRVSEIIKEAPCRYYPAFVPPSAAGHDQ